MNADWVKADEVTPMVMLLNAQPCRAEHSCFHASCMTERSRSILPALVEDLGNKLTAGGAQAFAVLSLSYQEQLKRLSQRSLIFAALK